MRQSIDTNYFVEFTFIHSISGLLFPLKLNRNSGYNVAGVSSMFLYLQMRQPVAKPELVVSTHVHQKNREEKKKTKLNAIKQVAKRKQRKRRDIQISSQMR